MDQVKIGKFISKQRKLKELTQEELATKMGVSTNAVSKWERGLNLPDASIMQDLCKKLDISLNELFAGTEISEEDITQQSDETLLDVFRDSALKISKLRMKIIACAVIVTLLVFSLGKSFLVNNGVLIDDNLRYTQMYYSGEGNIKGDVNTKKLGHASIDFDIGANKYGQTVFKNPNAAFKRLKKDYEKELKMIADEFDLGPLSFLNFRHYRTFGAQFTKGTSDEQERVFFVAVVLGLYLNSFNDLPNDSGLISRIFN